MATARTRKAGNPARHPVTRASGVLGLAVVLTSCLLLGTGPTGHYSSTEQDVAAAAGWTRIAVTNSYVVVANVLPGERMFTVQEAESTHPTEGELIMSGTGRTLGAFARHIEVHIYDRTTGLPLADLAPTIDVLNRTTGEHIEVESTLMQDLDLGAVDIHYGNNVAVPGNCDLRLTITIGEEEVIVDGHLD